MKKLHRKLALGFILLATVAAVSCGSLEQWSDGLRAVGSGLSGQPYTTTTATRPTQYSTASSTLAKEWHNCSQCSGTGRCRSCGGTGKYEYAKNGKCGVCLGTGKCAGCNGKGGWRI